MNGFRSFSFIVVILLIFTLMVVIIGGLAKGVNSGSVDPELLAAGVTGFLIFVIGGAFAAVYLTIRQHKEHTKQASSTDILAEIMAMKNEDNNDSKEDKPHDK